MTRLLRITFYVASCVAAASMVFARPQEAPSTSPLAGVWRLNTELSTPPTRGDREEGEIPPRAGRGRLGGRGGGRRGGMERGGPAGISAEQSNQMRALMTFINDAPARVVIVVTAETVTFTDEDGGVRRFSTDGTSESMTVDNGRVELEVKTTWHNKVLQQDISAGSLKVTRSCEASEEEDGRLTVTTRNEGLRSGRAGSPEIVHVYERAKFE